MSSSSFRLHHVNLPARDPEALAAWYAEHFGLTQEAGFARGPGVLLVFEPGRPLAFEANAHIGFSSPSVDAVRELAGRFSSPVVPFEVEPGFASFKARDPEGYVFEVYWEDDVRPLPGGVTIEPLGASEIPDCEGILRELPDWFGVEASIQGYVRGLAGAEGYVAREGEKVQAFLSLAQTAESAVEIVVMAARRARHRQGLGRALVEHVERALRNRGIGWLHVKTRGPSGPGPDEGYPKTRAFYRALGFAPLLETEAFDGPEDPTLILVKLLTT